MWITWTGTPCSTLKTVKLDRFQNLAVRTWTLDEFKVCCDLSGL